MSCFNSNKMICDCDAATVLLNVYIYIVFVGKDYFALVPSHLPHLRLLNLEQCDNVRDEYLEELVAAVPELKFVGEGYPALVPSHLPLLRLLFLEGCGNCDKYVEELVAVVPKLKVIK